MAGYADPIFGPGRPERAEEGTSRRPSPDGCPRTPGACNKEYECVKRKGGSSPLESKAQSERMSLFLGEREGSSHYGWRPQVMLRRIQYAYAGIHQAHRRPGASG